MCHCPEKYKFTIDAIGLDRLLRTLLMLNTRQSEGCIQNKSTTGETASSFLFCHSQGSKNVQRLRWIRAGSAQLSGHRSSCQTANYTTWFHTTGPVMFMGGVPTTTQPCGFLMHSGIWSEHNKLKKKKTRRLKEIHFRDSFQETLITSV